MEYPNYEGLVEATGCEVIGSLWMGDYQGDILMVVRKDGKFGTVSTGYGSCSGCDFLEGSESDEERAEYAKGLHDSILWQEPEDIIDYLENKDWEAEYYGRNPEIPDFVSNIKETIILRYLAGF